MQGFTVQAWSGCPHTVSVAGSRPSYAGIKHLDDKEIVNGQRMSGCQGREVDAPTRCTSVSIEIETAGIALVDDAIIGIRRFTQSC